MICSNITVKDGNLYFAGQSAEMLAAKYKTPLYLFDEDRIRANCRVYANAMSEAFGNNSKPLYAGKAASFKRMIEIIGDEGFGLDVVSPGEIQTAIKAKFPLENAYFHSSNKSDEDIAFAIDNKIGYFVVDGADELNAISEISKQKGIKQKILLRLTPGIDPHTFTAVNTGMVDSKFGTAIETGQASELVKKALGMQSIELCGFHCHVGSQIFDADVFMRASEVMLKFVAEVKAKYGFAARELDLGGGFGVRYTENDGHVDISASIKKLGEFMKRCCEGLNIELPAIRLEPGRSIAADAGMTLYTVGSVKTIPGYKNYVSIDGGMTDNPRYALYRSGYTVFAANRMNEANDFRCSLVGRCCESGDIIQENILLPHSVKRGDLIAVATTGAYNYSMASNYNRVCRPAVVMLHNGESYVAVKRESLEYLTENDV